MTENPLKCTVVGEDIVRWKCPKCEPEKVNIFRDDCWWCGFAPAHIPTIEELVQGSLSESEKS